MPNCGAARGFDSATFPVRPAPPMERGPRDAMCHPNGTFLPCRVTIWDARFGYLACYLSARIGKPIALSIHVRQQLRGYGQWT